VGDTRSWIALDFTPGFPNSSLTWGIAMKRQLGSTVVFALVFGSVFAAVNSASAQGFNIGGFNQQSNDDDDDDNRDDNRDDDSNQGSNQGGRRSRSSRSSSNNSGGNNVEDQIQQFFPGGQNNQNQNNQGQGGSNQSRRSNGQKGFPTNQQQFDNWNNGNQNQNSITIGGWNAGKWQGSRKVDNWTKQYGGNQQPFSSQWYKDHPKAWRYDGNNNANTNIWVGGSLPGLYGWLGWGNVPQQYRGNYGNNVPQFDRAHYGEWYPLGVFSLMAGPGDSGSRIVQLAVDQHGHISGNYYDMITGSNYSVTGDISRQNQRATWSLNKNQFVRFRAPVYQLLQPYGNVTVSLPGGNQQWQFVRLEN
jgi:hypothetical protein